MSFFQRAASFVVMSLGIAAICAGSPGLAFELNNGNVPAAISVPLSADAVVAETPAVAPEPATVAPAIAADHGDYPNLAAAVAAQDDSPDVDNNLRCLAGAIYFEAKGEPLSGQLAVAEVIMNRAKSGRFASSICSVVTQRGQFSFVRGGRIPAVASNANYRTAMAIAQVAMTGDWDSPAADALYFHARRVSPGWRMQKVAAIGNHIFYR